MSDAAGLCVFVRFFFPFLSGGTPHSWLAWIVEMAAAVDASIRNGLPDGQSDAKFVLLHF